MHEDRASSPGAEEVDEPQLFGTVWQLFYERDRKAISPHSDVRVRVPYNPNDGHLEANTAPRVLPG